MKHWRQKIAETSGAVAARWNERPAAGVILGSGLGDLAQRIDCQATFDYADLPHFGATTAIGHAGRLVCGRLEDRPVVAFQGRFHLYEGHRADRAALPARLLQALGCTTLVVSNAAGGLNPQYRVGEVMAIDDHINLQFDNPLIGVNDDQLGPRFPDMSAPYDREYLEIAEATARAADFRLHRGVYVAMLGPTYETRAEYRMCRRLGGDAVGMSTAPEVIAARHAGLRVAGFSVITNVGSPDAPQG
ncbi:MAG: purine-nucleoside phosphorylase, partial [Planctomycetales bacterium]|nr:purine-nucleoside phosphorylase [Planctomycetales bacterium]